MGDNLVKICPECGSPMIKRIARRGQYAGNTFWGCSRYPKCKCIVNVDKEDEFEQKSSAKSAETSSVTPTVEMPLESEGFTSKGISVDYSALPYKKYSYMESYGSIGISDYLLKRLNNETIDEAIIRSYCNFRVDYAGEGTHGISPKQRQICSMALRLLCRGIITRNSQKVEDELRQVFGKPDYTDEDIKKFSFYTIKNTDYSFDSELERYFAENILSEVIGPRWQNFTETQVLISSLLNEENSFSDQRVDFLISDGTHDIIVELDGGEHERQKDKDRERDSYLLRNGFKTIRIPNDDVTSRRDEVVQILRAELDFNNQIVPETDGFALEILAHKCIHQAEIAILSGLIKGYIGCDSSITMKYAAGNFFDKERIAVLILEDLKELLDEYCKLFNEPAFFSCKSVNGAHADVSLSFGETDGDGSSTILISDICLSKTIRNEIPGCPDLQIEDAPEDILLYFLKYVFRFNSFREGQFVAISRMLERLDSIVLLPTGSGKSLIYQLASLLLPGKVIVVEPLVALMEDQLFNLHDVGLDCAVTISSGNVAPTSVITDNAITLIYVSPERLQMQSFRDSVDTIQISSRICAVAIDEAHCVSEWGHDFRTAYLNIGRTTRSVFNYHGQRPTLIALTGTASTAVLKDVKRELEINEYDAIITPETFNREELHFKVVSSRSDDKENKLREILTRAIPDYFGRSSNVFYSLNGEATNGGIVFCPHVNGNYGVLAAERVVDTSNIKSDVYSGKEPKDIDTRNWEARKKEVAKKFKQNKINTLVSTKAFGMGIDKPNIRFTVHYGIPSSIESFYQEAGRAGRGQDVHDALCTIIISDENDKEDDFLLNPITSLEEIKTIIDKHSFDDQDDVSRMLWFHVNSFKGIETEIENVRIVLEKLFPDNNISKTPVIIGYEYGRDIEKMDQAQKAVQRLLVLGVISDYTVDYNNKEIKLYPGSTEKDDIKSKYADYVRGYNEGRVATELRKLDEIIADSDYEYVLGCARVLTEFIYDTIEKGRRRGLREIRNAAVAALASSTPDDTLRQRVVRYFETTYADELNLITDDNELGFGIIPFIIDGREIEDTKEVVGGIRSCTEASGLRGGASRYLESTPDHPGLLAIRALAELLCKDYDEELISEDIAACCKYAVSRYSYSKEKLERFLYYFMEKAMERDSALLYPLSDKINEYCDVFEMCRSLLDSTNLSEESKEEPARIYFGNIAKNTLDTIRSLKGEE